MKTSFKRSKAFLFLLLPVAIWGQYATKTIERQYPLPAKGTFELNNRFGDVTIESWDKQQVDIKVVVKVYGNDDEVREDQLENIYPVFEANSDRVAVKTVIEKEKNKSWWKLLDFFQNNNDRFQIDYWVKLPSSAKLNTKNSYGATFIDRHDGPTTIACSYGNLSVNALRNANNKIVIKYSDDSEIEFLNGGTVIADYSDLQIDQARTIELDADYSKTKIEAINSLSFSIDYGKLEVGKVALLEGDADYVGIRIDELSKRCTVDLDYGAFKIYTLLPSTEEVELNADYAGLSLGIDPNWGFEFEVTTEYASLKSDLDLNYRKKIIEQEDHYYQGTYNGGGGKLNIQSDYGAVKLNKN